MSNAKAGALVMSALLVMYIALLSNTGILLLGADNLLAKSIGALILAFPILGAWAIFMELRFGIAAEKLCRRVEQEGTWPNLGIELRPSGRPVRSSADAVFATWHEAANATPGDWHSWFNLSLAYDACGDRRRARAMMRKAIGLAKTS